MYFCKSKLRPPSCHRTHRSNPKRIPKRINNHLKHNTMKKLVFMALIAFAGMGIANAQNVNPQSNGQQPAEQAQQENVAGPKIVFSEMEHNYGTIEKGSDGNCTFEFTNTGNEPLILVNVRASCGCTTPEWTQKPVMPGKTGSIQVRYNTNNVGGFSKTVTVQSNAVDNPRIVLRIKGNVITNETQQ